MSTKNDTKSDGKITLVDVRCGFPHLFEAKSVEAGGTKRYSITLLIPKGTDEGKAYKAQIDKLIAAVKADKPKTFKPKPSRICLKDGDTDESAKPEYAGHWFINANRNESQGQPQVVDRKKQPITDAKAIYGGCYVSAVIGIYGTDKGGDAIPASLEIVQKRKDGDRFGGGSTASLDDLPDLEDDEEDGLDDLDDLE